MTTAKLTLKIVGPMKRSTFQQQSPDPVKEAVNDLLHWSWSTRLQISRLTRSVRADIKAMGWQQGVRRNRRTSATSFDEHILLVAAANLERGIRKAPKAVRREATLPESPLRLYGCFATFTSTGIRREDCIEEELESLKRRYSS